MNSADKKGRMNVDSKMFVFEISGDRLRQLTGSLKFLQNCYRT